MFEDAVAYRRARDAERADADALSRLRPGAHEPAQEGTILELGDVRARHERWLSSIPFLLQSIAIGRAGECRTSYRSSADHVPALEVMRTAGKPSKAVLHRRPNERAQCADSAHSDEFRRSAFHVRSTRIGELTSRRGGCVRASQARPLHHRPLAASEGAESRSMPRLRYVAPAGRLLGADVQSLSDGGGVTQELDLPPAAALLPETPGDAAIGTSSAIASARDRSGAGPFLTRASFGCPCFRLL